MTHRLARFVAVLVPVVLSGCATKRDIRDLETLIQQMRTDQVVARQEARENEKSLKNELADRIASLGGEMKHQQGKTEERIARIEEMTGYAQRGVAEVQRQLKERNQRQELAPGTDMAFGPVNSAAPQITTTEAPCDPPKNAAPILETTRKLLKRNVPSTATARDGALAYIRCYADQPGVAEARLLLAETYVLDGDSETALARFADLLSHHPNSPEAPTALYRMGAIEADRRNNDAARKHWERLIRDYPKSSEARLATEGIQKLKTTRG